MRALILILGAVLGMSEKRVQFKLAATVAYESVPSRAEQLGEAAGLSQVKRVFRHAPKHEAKHRAQGLHLWYTGAAATALSASAAVAAAPVYQRCRPCALCLASCFGAWRKTRFT